MDVKNLVQLITYPDSLGGDLKTLEALLDRHFADIFGGVHILPPFPSSGDRGFAPLTYFEIEPSFGNWDDVRRIGERYDVVVDLMVNHISRRSPYFQDFQQHGRQSDYADIFLTLDKVWPGGEPPAEDVGKIFLRRPLHPFVEVEIAGTGQVEKVWATFGTRDWSEQMDVDVRSPLTRKLFTEILTHFSRQNVRMVRLDAIAYVTKKAGTNCFFVEPDIYDFIDWIQTEAAAVGIRLLPELHAHFSYQEKLAQHGCQVYNFAIPLLVLHSLYSRDGRALKEHLQTCPRNQITMLDCHDGIPVQPDLDDILGVDEAQAVVQACLERGANLSRVLSDAHKRRPDFDAHQINITYYTALDANPDAYLAARALQLFAPGIPQVYYVGLLAGLNDPLAVEQTGERRAINRHNYTTAEVEQALQQDVVQRLLRLIRFRNQFEAFNGTFTVEDSPDHLVVLAWQHGSSACRLTVDLNNTQAVIDVREADGTQHQYVP